MSLARLRPRRLIETPLSLRPSQSQVHTRRARRSTTRATVSHVSDRVSSVSVIDGATNTVDATIPIGPSDTIVDLAVNASTNRVYATVSDASAGGLLVVIDGATKTVLRNIELGAGTAAGTVAVNPATNRAYVYGFSSNLVDPFVNPAGSGVFVVDLSTNQVVDLISVPHCGLFANIPIEVNPRTNRIYLAEFGCVPAPFIGFEPSLLVIDGNANALLATIPLDQNFPNYVAVDSGTAARPANRVFVSSVPSSPVLRPEGISVVDGATNAVTGTFKGALDQVAFNPNTNRLYASWLAPVFGELAVIDPETGAIDRTFISSGALAVNQTTDTLYIVGDGAVFVVGDVDPAAADLAVAKADSPDPVRVGEPLTYTLTVTNNGPAEATGVTLTDTLPAGVDYVSADPDQGSCSELGGTVRCDLGSLAGGTSTTVRIVVTPTAPGTPCNTASVDADQDDPNPDNDSAEECATVEPAAADLAVAKADSPDPVRVGQALTYTLMVTKNGPADATGVTLTDTLPAGVDYVSADPDQGSCSELGGTVRCDLGSLAGGTSTTVRIVVRPTAPGQLCNLASVDADRDDPISVEECTTVEPTAAGPALSIGDVEVTEGDAGTVNAELEVSLSGASEQDVTVEFETHNNTAEAPGDYETLSRLVTFRPGRSLTQKIPVPVKGDLLDESDEAFTAELTNPQGAMIVDGHGEATIYDDDPAVECRTLRFGHPPTEDAIDLAGRIDCFSFDAADADVVRVRVVKLSGEGFTPRTTVRRPDRTLVPGCELTTSRAFECTLDATGTHSILVGDAAGTHIGDYVIAIQRLNAPVGCTTLRIGDPPTEDAIRVAGETDCFRFDGADDDVVRVRMVKLSDSAGFFQPRAEVWRPNGTLVPGCSLTGRPAFECMLDDTGPHTILVRDALGTDTGDYVIAIQRLNAPLGCTTLRIGDPPTEDAIRVAGETDCFRFDGADGDVVRVRMVKLSDSAGFRAARRGVAAQRDLGARLLTHRPPRLHLRAGRNRNTHNSRPRRRGDRRGPVQHPTRRQAAPAGDHDRLRPVGTDQRPNSDLRVQLERAGFDVPVPRERRGVHETVRQLRLAVRHDCARRWAVHL